MKRPHKYGAVATTVDGIRFPSLKEARRWSDLKLLEKAGVISELKRQVRHPMIVAGQKVCDYVSDATYIENGVFVVEDSKGMLTDVFKLKAKLFKAIYGFEIRVVK